MLLIKVVNRSVVVPLRTLPVFNMGMLTDKLTERQTKKSYEQFKKQIEHMANKPSFTIMDYRQRIIDELAKLKSSFRKNLAKEAAEMQKNLQIQKKVLNAVFEEELLEKKNIDFLVKKQIALVTGVQMDKVNDVFTKALNYQKMHKLLRSYTLAGKPLPQTMEELQYKFKKSKYIYNGTQKRRMRYKMQNNRCEGSMRAMRIRYSKFNK